MTFLTFRHKSNGVVANYPEEYATHPVFGFDLELYNPEAFEEDKVVVDTHDLPVDQRITIVATSLEDMTVVQLREILRDRQLDISGSKDELIARIKENNEEN